MARDDQMTRTDTGRDTDQSRNNREDVGQTTNQGVRGEKGGKAGAGRNNSRETDAESWNDSSMNEV